MKRNIFSAAIILCLTVTISACESQHPVDDSSPAGDALLSSNQPKIVFHDTIEDPQGEYMNTLGGGCSETSGTTELNLILYETEPNVFEGCGIMSRSLDIAQWEAGGSTQKYIYRTGLIHAKTDQEGSITLTGWLTNDSDISTMISDAPFDVLIHKDATLRQEEIPVLLTLNGNQASLSMKLHDHAEFIFSGELTTESTEVPMGESSNPENLIYINSMWSSSFSGGPDDGEYTAVFLASPKAGNYSGQLSIHGTGKALNDISEAVTFSLEPFDAAAYQKAGGQLDDRFTSMSILNIAGGSYILLRDGQQVILEPAGKGVYFCGSMPSASESDYLQNEAAKTRRMLSYLYRQKSGTEAAFPDYSELKGLDPNNQEDMKKLMQMSEQLNTLTSHQDVPSWYPEDLIPMVNYSAYDGFGTLPPVNGLLFRIYNTEYCEEEDFEDLVGPYRGALSGYDNYKEYLDYDHAEGVFLFTMGKYTIQVFLSQSVIKLTDVGIQIF